MRIAIVGAGMAGLACAEALVAGGHVVSLFDKGRGAGGRMSTRRLATPIGEARFDHGAQYFTVREPAFAERVTTWEKAGVVARWPAGGGDAWVGTPGMNAPVRDMAVRADVRWNARVDGLASGAKWRVIGVSIQEDGFDAVVVAVPAEQVAPLVDAHDAGIAAAARDTLSAPCWTAMAAFAERLPAEADVLRDRGPIGWAARDSAKPGRTGPESWVVQASPAWSRDHLGDAPADVEANLLRALADTVGAMPSPVAVAAHRWRYARSGAQGSGMLWNRDARLGVCGDWLLGPRVESAWMSGTRLAAAIADG